MKSGDIVNLPQRKSVGQSKYDYATLFKKALTLKNGAAVFVADQGKPAGSLAVWVNVQITRSGLDGKLKSVSRGTAVYIIRR